MDAFDQAVAGIARDCIAVRVRLLNRVISNLYDEALRPVGLKVSQLNILVVTALLGQVRPGQVCDLLQLDASTLSRNVERMAERGWMEAVPDPADARAHTLHLTCAGRQLLEGAIPAWKRAQGRACELLGPQGAQLLVNLARKFCTAGEGEAEVPAQDVV